MKGKNALECAVQGKLARMKGKNASEMCRSGLLQTKGLNELHYSHIPKRKGLPLERQPLSFISVCAKGA
ncbi:hypothetical protein GCM10010912_44740 [Paenibacillus albidus]|uniref:Uncharacterized protein n=1 Tax=Paenibacillus albidus TaxID=2041023 RepID=A0A917FNW8_9BACL|nr:hypothetical protein GCM10010912_44740 [Paenibacillus albidus]